MILVIRGKLETGDTEALKRTLLCINRASNWLSEQVCELRTVNRTKVHHACYRQLREQFGLPAALAISIIQRVVNAHKRMDSSKRFSKPIRFKKYSGVHLHEVAFAFRRDGSIGITTLDSGRLKYGVKWGRKRQVDFKNARKTLQLTYRHDLDAFFVGVLIQMDTPNTYTPIDYLGVDLGIANIAVCSDGTAFGGEALQQKKAHYRKKRGQLIKKKAKRRKQKRDVRSVSRRLKSISRRERNFTRDVLHTISKRVVAHAKALSLGIVLEDLKCARERLTVSAGRQHRIRVSGWAYRQLQNYIVYKAQLAGVPVVFVSARNTSRTCPECGYCDKRNRPSQAVFRCRECGYSAHADFVAARNLVLRAWGTNPCPQMPSASSG